MTSLLDAVRLLPSVIDRTVDSCDIDLNNHMNVARFFDAQVSSVREALAGAGINEDYIAQRRLGTFAAEHHLRYLGELRQGERFSTRVRFIGRSPKAIHLQSFLVNESRDQLACVLEVIGVHISQETRRGAEIPTDIAASLDERIAAAAAIDFETRMALRGA